MGFLKDLERGVTGGVNFLGDIAGDFFEGPVGTLLTGTVGREVTKSIRKSSRKEAEQLAASKVRNQSLLKLIKDDDQISDATRKELTSSLLNIGEIRGGSNLQIAGSLASSLRTEAEISSRLKEAKVAKEGSVFASRQGTEELLKILKDQPGRSQFVSSGRSKNSSLGV